MKKIAIFLSAILLGLTGCSNGMQTQDYICKDVMSIPQNMIGLSDSNRTVDIPYVETVSLILNKGNVASMKDIISYNTKDIGFSEEYKNEFKRMLDDSFTDEYRKEGVTLESKLTIKGIDFILTLDFKDIDLASGVLQTVGIDSTFFNENKEYPLNMIESLLLDTGYQKEAE